MSDTNPGPASSTVVNLVTPTVIPGVFTFATLPSVSAMTGYPAGTTAYTSDQGLVFWTGSAWQEIILAPIYPVHPQETAAGVTPVNLNYLPGFLWRYLTAAQIGDAEAGTLLQDCTTGIQNWIKACESSLAGDGLLASIPAGTYKITTTINFTKRFISISGCGGMLDTVFSASNFGGKPIFKFTTANAFWSPKMEGFWLNGDSTTGHAIDTSVITGAWEMYLFSFRDLFTISGGAAIYATNAFSGTFHNWFAQSINNHAFIVQCGVGIAWISCYASQCFNGTTATFTASVGSATSGTLTVGIANGTQSFAFSNGEQRNVTVTGGTSCSWTGALQAGTITTAVYGYKAGFRLGGTINLYSCVGIDPPNGAMWGIFGQNPSDTDGFQNDLVSGATDYPSVTMVNCDVESFAIAGIMCHNSARTFQMMGGQFDRSRGTLPAKYHSMLRFKLGTIQNTPIRLNTGAVFLGSGTPAFTGGYIYSDTRTYIEDAGGAWLNVGVTQAYGVEYTQTYPLITRAGVADVYNDHAEAISAISPRRLSAQMIRYVENTLTPVGSNQAINVTGYTKVVVTPAAPASISTATFTQTVGGGLDFGRNGDLIIECGNGNLTINHSASGANTFSLKDGVNIVGVAGQVFRFLWSDTNSQWLDVRGPAQPVRGDKVCLQATAIETRSSTTTLTNSTQLTYAIPIAGTYALRLVVYSYFTTAVTDGITANVNYSGTFTAVGSYITGYLMNGTTTTTGIQPVEISATVNNALTGLTMATYGAAVAAATPAVYVIEGELIATGTGTVAFAFAQATSGVDTTNLGVGSYMTVTQVS